MNNYLTRHLEALTEIAHGGRLVAIGERFDASELDAGYYLSRNLAVPVPEAAAAVVTQHFSVGGPVDERTEQQIVTRRGPGRPRKIISTPVEPEAPSDPEAAAAE